MNKNNMFISTIIMGVIALVLFIYSYTKGVHLQGLDSALKIGLKTLPLLIIAFAIVGLVSKLDFTQNVSAVLGNESGIKGIGMGALAGVLTPGGPFVAIPFASVLLKSGAGIGSVMSYFVAWATWEIMRTPFEIGFLGWKFMFVKWCTIIILPIIAGLTAKLLFSWVNF